MKPEIYYCMHCEFLEIHWRGWVDWSYWCARDERRIGYARIRPAWCFRLTTTAPDAAAFAALQRDLDEANYRLVVEEDEQ